MVFQNADIDLNISSRIEHMITWYLCFTKDNELFKHCEFETQFSKTVWTKISSLCATYQVEFTHAVPR